MTAVNVGLRAKPRLLWIAMVAGLALLATGLFVGAVALALAASSSPFTQGAVVAQAEPGPIGSTLPRRATLPQLVRGEPPAAGYEVAFANLPQLSRPLALLEVPGQDLLLVVLADGRIFSMPKGGPYSSPRTVHDQRDNTFCCGTEEGLLSAALDPEFGTNGYLYAYYSPPLEEPVTRLVRFETSGSGSSLRVDPASEFLILEVEQPFRNHNGGTIAFGPDGMLYLGLGDGGAAGDPRGYGQDTAANLLGSVIRIDVRGASLAQPYRVPPDNPFVDDADVRDETWAFGLRNPWRMSFDRETGLLWVGDVGQIRREEVDIVRGGENFGWNVTEGTLCFEPEEACDRAGLTAPVWDYSHDDGCSVTGGYVYRGQAMPSLRGWYVFSDFCAGGVWAIYAEAAALGGRVEAVRLIENGPGVVSFAEDPDGELYFLTFSDDRMYRIVPD